MLPLERDTVIIVRTEHFLQKTGFDFEAFDKGIVFPGNFGYNLPAVVGIDALIDADFTVIAFPLQRETFADEVSVRMIESEIEGKFCPILGS